MSFEEYDGVVRGVRRYRSRSMTSATWGDAITDALGVLLAVGMSPEKYEVCDLGLIP